MNNKKVQVCSSCLKASCWYGEFRCEEYLSADLTIKTVEELRKLKLENEDYWSDEYMEKVYGESSPFGYADEEPPKYEYSFTGVRITSCEDCPIGGFETIVDTDGNIELVEYCIFNDSVECSDISRPSDCPFVERKCEDE